MMEDYRARHVLFLPRWYPSNEDPLLGIFIQRHAQICAQISTVSVLYIRSAKSWGQEFSPDKSLSVLRYFYPSKITGIYFLDRFLKLFIYFFLSIKGYFFLARHYGKPSLIHVHVLLKTGLVALVLKKIFKIPFVVTEHSSGFILNQNKGFKPYLQKLVLKSACGISVVSAILGSAISKITGRVEGIHRISNVVDTDFFIPLTQKVHNKPIRILHVSEMMDEAKNIGGMMRAVNQVWQTRKDFRLDIVGYGKDEQKLKTLSTELGLTDQVIFFHPKKQGTELLRYFQECDFFLLFSNYETFGIVLAEAMSCGKPVLATRAGAIPEFVDDSSGMLTEPGNEAKLAMALELMLQNYASYNSPNIRKKIVNLCSPDKIKVEFKNFYNSVLKK